MIGRSESILAMCQALHYDLVALHVQIQLLAANWKLGKTEQALELLRGSLSQLSRWNPYAICGELSIHRGAFEGKLFRNQ